MTKYFSDFSVFFNMDSSGPWVLYTHQQTETTSPRLSAFVHLNRKRNVRGFKYLSKSKTDGQANDQAMQVKRRQRKNKRLVRLVPSIVELD